MTRTAVVLLVTALLCGCGHMAARSESAAISGSTAPAGTATGRTAETGSYLLLNQRFIEGSRANDVNLNDPDAVFWHIYSRLPDEVIVYPSENYYYFILNVNGRQIWGNIRLPAGKRELGELSFGYFEFKEFPQLRGPKTGLSRSKFFTAADGLRITSDDKFTWHLDYRGRKVTFHLHQIAQVPPKSFRLGDDEKFIQRTFDESGYEFFLIFNEKSNYFFWVLNEENVVPDTLTPDAKRPELVIGEKSGFAFWVDQEHDNRKVMVAIRKLNSNRNDYYDGPFDQLADNYADECRISDYMQLAAPSLRGRIDKYGYYTDKARPMRVALACYYSYLAPSDLHAFFQRAQDSDDIYKYISRRGIPEYKPGGGSLPPAPASTSPTAVKTEEKEN